MWRILTLHWCFLGGNESHFCWRLGKPPAGSATVVDIDETENVKDMDPAESIFMTYLLKALAENANRYITTEDLYDAVRKP